MFRQPSSETPRIQPKLGDVFMIQFDGSGSVQRGYRPGVIFSNNRGNSSSPNVIVFPLTTSLKKLSMPTHVVLDAETCGLKFTSMVLCENPQCIPKSMLRGFISHLSDEVISRIAVAQLASSSGIAFLDYQSLIAAWELTIRLSVM